MTPPADGRADGGRWTGGRREELLAAAAVDDLAPGERTEVDELLASDPTAAEELASMRAVLAALPPRGSGWDDSDPPDILGETVLGATAGRSSPRLRRRGRVLGAAAALLLLGGACGWVAAGLRDAPSSGPPGTLGAVEELEPLAVVDGVSTDLAVVAHRWGTETVLDIAGLPAGQVYTVVLVDETGQGILSGTFIATGEAVVSCRMNAAVLREDVAALEVRAADGEEVVTAALPVTR